MTGILRVLLLLTASAVGGFFSSAAFAERVYSPKTLQGPVAPFSHLYGSGYASLDAALAAANTVSHNAGCFDWAITATFQPSAVGSYHAADMHTDSQGKSSCGTFTKPINAYAKMLCPDGYTADTTKADTDPQACWKDVEDPPPPADCSSLEGQTLTINTICQRATCPGGLFYNDSLGVWDCPTQMSVMSQAVPSSIADSGCKAAWASNTVNYHTSSSIQAGDTEADVYCDSVYTYTGEPADSNDSPPPSDGGGGGGSPINAGGSGGDSGGGSGGDSGGGSGGDTGGGSGGDTGGGSGGDTGGGTGGDTGGGSGGDTGAPCVPTETQPCDEKNTGTAHGPCDTPPVCSGDALQCAILQQIWESSCEAQRVKPEVTQQAEETLTQAQGEYASKQAEVDAQVSGLASGFASSLSVGAGPCFPDQSISVMGKTVTIPYSDACEYFQYLRFLLILFAYYRAARVIYEAF